MAKTQHTYRVYVAQVNQTCVTVLATDEENAAEKGYLKWRRVEGHSRVVSVEKAQSEEV